MAVKRPGYIGLAGVCLLACLLSISCQQMAVSYMQERQKARYIADSLSSAAEKEYGEEQDDLQYARRYDILERKKSGEDSLFLVREYYTNGQKASDIWYNDDKKEGLGILYYPGGAEYARVIYKDNKPYTILESYRADHAPLDGGTLKNGVGSIKNYSLTKGFLKSVLEFKDGVRNGSCIKYYSNGKKNMECGFLNGKMHGEAKSFYKNGAIYQTSSFSNGLPVGIINTYYVSGRLKKQQTFEKNSLVRNEEFDESGKITTVSSIRDSQLVKIRMDYYANGAVRSVARFVNEYKNGNFNYYYENKALRSREVWRNDTLLGETTWHENGKVKSEATCKNGEREGTYREYYSNGGLRLEQEYHDGLKDGKFMSYFKNGKLYSSGNYEKEKPKGKFEIYAEDGTYKGANTY